ncbi:MAG TPA: CinA family protein [Acetobacteraceae bacterium]|jgi:nicotinamide-nucleotide amidase|nr:CinA family protein [Acetobacteraceae bacterium]
MIPDALLDEAASLLEACRARGIRLATAEGCTGGLIAGVLTAVAGSSDVLERGFVAYSNAAKTELLGVPAETIAAVGAVSGPVTERMAEAALQRSHADIAVAVTGVTGPDGSSVDKPIGLVWFGLAARDQPVFSERQVFPGNRTAVRIAAVARTLTLIRGRLR